MVVIFIFFLFGLHHSCERQKTTTICDHCHLCFVLFLFFLNTKDNNRKSSSSCLFFLAFVAPMKDKKWQRSMIVNVFVSSYSHSSQTQKRQHKVVIFVFFSFWPFSFLWKVKDNDDLWLSSSSPPHVLTFLKHKRQW